MLYPRVAFWVESFPKLINDFSEEKKMIVTVDKVKEKHIIELPDSEYMYKLNNKRRSYKYLSFIYNPTTQHSYKTLTSVLK